MHFILDILGRMRGLERRSSMLLSSYPGHPEFDCLLSAFYLYRTNFLGASLDDVGRFEVHGAVSADKACPIPMIDCHKYGL